MKLLFAILLLGGTFTALGQVAAVKESADPFSITIGPSSQTVNSASQVKINIHLTNTSNHDINGSSAYFDGADASYRQEVRDAEGKLANKEQPPTSTQHLAGHWTRQPLRPGESADSQTGISPEFDISKPGHYTIRLSRPISERPADGTVKSNTITVTVTE